MFSKLQNVIFRHVRNLSITNLNHKTLWRHNSNSSTIDPTKQVVVQGPTNLVRFRVRRARSSDVTRLISFVRENAALVWPGLFNESPTKNINVLLADFVSRTLCQGHSMVAEQQEAGRGWSLVRGLALNTCVCPWDAMMLEKWAHCIKCAQFKKLMMLSAHCLRAPDLHEKYSVHNVLQIILMVPPQSPKATQITQVLAKTSIQRGRDLGYPVLRFDVASDLVNKTLSNLKLVKEWEFNYDINREAEKVCNSQGEEVEGEDKDKSSKKEQSIIVVYTAFPQRKQV